jgi:hypothetical protein
MDGATPAPQAATTNTTEQQELRVADVQVVQPLRYGQTAGPIAWTPPAAANAPIKYQGYTFAGTKGDVVEIVVTAPAGFKSYVWLTNDVGSAVAQSPFGTVRATLGETGQFLIGVREGNLNATSFTISLKGTPAPPPPPPPPPPPAGKCTKGAMLYRFATNRFEMIDGWSDDIVAGVTVNYLASGPLAGNYVWVLTDPSGKAIEVPAVPWERGDPWASGPDLDRPSDFIKPNWNTMTVEFDTVKVTGINSRARPDGSGVDHIGYMCKGRVPLRKTF